MRSVNEFISSLLASEELCVLQMKETLSFERMTCYCVQIYTFSLSSQPTQVCLCGGTDGDS